MDAARLIESLEHTTAALSALLADVSPDDAGWRPDPGAWSIAEIVGHLLAEERDDFRPRLRSTLEDPRAPWPAIDPERAVRDARHAGQDLARLRRAFLEERRASMTWLKELDGVDWTPTYQHAEFGPITAGDLLASWAAHDVLHLRQITSRLFRLVEAAAAPHSPRYAGPLT